MGLTAPWLPDPPAKKGTAAYAAWAKECFLELLKAGFNYSQAAEYLGYQGYKWWDQQKKKDPEWAAEAESIRNRGVGSHDDDPGDYPDLTGWTFEQFVEHYGGFTLAEHQRRIADAVQDPRAKQVLILGHPESGKSTIISLWYVLYRIAQNPDIRIAVVSKSTPKAKDLLRRIKRYLSEPHLYDDTPGNLVADFGGFQPIHGELEWSSDQIFIRQRRSGERDPTVQALGIGKQIYGARLDLLILDDSLVLDNQRTELQREHIDIWFTGEARSRAQKGQTVICGTRLFPLDLYGQWRKALSGHPLFREVIIPAILDEWTDDERASWPEYWTLDGYNLITELDDGTEIITGYQPGLRDIRSEVMAKSEDSWKLVYQQENVDQSSMIFREDHVQSAFDLGANRTRGQVFEDEVLILGVDPAVTGRAASVVLAYNTETRVRTVIDLYVGENLGATGIRQKLVYQFLDKYKDHGFSTVVIEVNYAPTLMGDEAFMSRVRSTGARMEPFKTTARGKKKGSKWDDEYGVASMSALFGNGLIAFVGHNPDDHILLTPLVDDMLTFPYSEIQDALMALWFANSEVPQVIRRTPPHEEMQRRRQVPPIIRNRRRVALHST